MLIWERCVNYTSLHHSVPPDISREHSRKELQVSQTIFALKQKPSSPLSIIRSKHLVLLLTQHSIGRFTGSSFVSRQVDPQISKFARHSHQVKGTKHHLRFAIKVLGT